MFSVPDQQTGWGFKGVARNHIKGVQERLFASFRQSCKTAAAKASNAAVLFLSRESS